MLIQNLLYRAGHCELQDAGDLDGQILADFRDLAARLRKYQSEHLDKKVKGRSNHYEQWSEENAKKIAYADRVVEVMEQASHAGPFRTEMDMEGFYAMPPAIRHAWVLQRAMDEIAAVGNYDMDTVIIERQSAHAEDWYLWSAAACHKTAGTWSAWTLNLSLGGLHGGHYGMSSTKDVSRVMAAKKGLSLEPEEKQETEYEEE